jgi:hypothetical protein
MEVTTNETIWDDISDIAKILNLIPSETVVIRLPTVKVSSAQLLSSSWKEFLHCKVGEYEPNSIDIYCYRGENVPNLIIFPEKLETRLAQGIPFFILTSKHVFPIGQHVMRGGMYEIVIADKNQKMITGEQVNAYAHQNYVNRYLKGNFFIFPKMVSDDFIDRVILQFNS